MKKKGLIVLVVLAALAIAGCTTTSPVDLTSNPVGTKVGEASGTLRFGGAFGGTVDYSLQTAAKNGGITKISTVDLRVKNLGIFGVTYTTIVTGE
jgi:hypothetical protein